MGQFKTHQSGTDYSRRAQGCTNHSTITVKERFRGALLGLMLAPTAVSITLSQLGDPDIAQTATTGNSTVKNSLTTMEGAIARVLKQVNGFLKASDPRSTNSDHSSLTRAPYPAWIESIPILLRYHDQPAETRHDFWPADEPTRQPTAPQTWLISDVLSQALNGQPLDRDWLAQQAAQSGWADSYHERWRTLQQMLSPAPGTPTAQRSQVYNHDKTLKSLASSEIESHRAVVTGISCALAPAYEHRAFSQNNCNYGLSVSMATRAMVATQKMTAGKMTPASHWEVPLIAGLVSGAIVGYGALPIRWQQQRQQSQQQSDLALADALFDHWAGIKKSRSPEQTSAKFPLLKQPTIIKK